MNDSPCVCSRVGAVPAPLSPSDRIAISRTLLPLALRPRDRFLTWPINGLRLEAHGNMCGWYLWAGPDFSTDPDWFSVIHFHHLDRSLPFFPYLTLPPGWRFLVAPGYEDVWQDSDALRPQQ